MTPAIRRLLSLPTSIRQQYLDPRVLSENRHISGFLQSRCFGLSTRSLEKQGNIHSPKRIGSVRPSESGPVRSPPRAPVKRPDFSSQYIDRIDPGSDRILLYAATRHGTFYFASYFVGATLLFGAYSHAEMFLKDQPDQPRKPIAAKILGGVATLFIAVLGTAVLLAPSKLIRSIAIVTVPAAKGAPATRKLRFEIRRMLPFLKPDVLETDPSKVVLDRNVPNSTRNIGVYDVLSHHSQTLTERYFAGKWAPQEGQKGVFSALNRALTNAWPIMKRETLRMCLRDQMAYVRIQPNGNFKMDLRDCTLLDSGKPLDKMVEKDEVRQSVLGITRGLFRR